MDVIQRIAEELSVNIKQVATTVQLLDEGATVPFIARYRKEMTGGLDDSQLRTLDERLIYLRELNDRRKSILESIRSQKLLTPELEKSITLAETKTRLKDLYLPFKPKRRSKAQIALEAGLGPLADHILEHRNCIPEQIALTYINVEKGFPDPETALEGARRIIMERVSENAMLLDELRERIWDSGILESTVTKNSEKTGEKFSDYFDYQEAIRKIPSHRAMALFRGRNEHILKLTLKPAADDETAHRRCEQLIMVHLDIENSELPANKWLTDTARSTWKIKLFTRIDLDLKLRLRESAELEATRVFASNLRDLLMAAPAGPKVTMGLDPGIRTGVKVAIVDATGKLLETETIYPHPPLKKWDESKARLAALIQQHQVDLICIGNGTGSRETDQLVSEINKLPTDKNFSKMMISEAGASVYSASELAARELPGIDVTLRGAVSIARRLQDPLAELVKIEPKAIGVGQYQHDVNQSRLGRSLDTVVEDCVNAVGVDVNTASPELLNQVSGLSASVSRNIVEYRNENGPFIARRQLKKIPRLGHKAFEQSAGFLRIMNGSNLLDASAVHPEAYPVIQKILDQTGKGIQDLIGKSSFLRQLNPADYTDETFGLPTVTDILLELEKPGRDPRPEFTSLKFKAGIEKISDLESGMKLEGIVTNVANFGAFVDIGVHQDGLVHISQLADVFVKDPRDIVKTGLVVKVTVMEVDLERKRISLSMKQQAHADAAQPAPAQKKKPVNKRKVVQSQGAMAQALTHAFKK